ncbi:MAG: hypothetical protein HYW90_04740 [Candidatus Sungbacteria bacterium]|nr:hypothetical protein [Candidatus Sungbacteria bacterium]
MTDMKHLVFGEGLMNPSLDGSKRFTIRKYRKGAHDFTVGEIVIGEFRDGLNILLQITDATRKATFAALRSPYEMLDAVGYYFDQEYFEDLQRFYPELSGEDIGVVIFFEVLKVNGVPVVSFNEHAPREE